MKNVGLVNAGTGQAVQEQMDLLARPMSVTSHSHDQTVLVNRKDGGRSIQSGWVYLLFPGHLVGLPQKVDETENGKRQQRN